MKIETYLQRIRCAVKGHLGGDAIRRLVLAMAAGISSRLGLLALSIVVGRSFGTADFGAFTFATGLALVVGQLAALGWPMLMNRLIPAYREAADWPALRGLLRSGNVIVLGSTLTASTMILLAAHYASALSRSLLFAAVLVPPLAFCMLRRQQLAAFRRAHFGLLLDQGFGAVCTVLLFFALGGMALGEVVLTYAATTLLGTLAGAFLVGRLAPPELKNRPPIYRIAAWMALSFPLLIGMSSRLLLGKVDVLLIAPLSDLQETGLFGAAFRITYVLSFPLAILMSLATPAIAQACARRDTARLQRVVCLSLVFTAVTVLPLLVGILLFAEDVLRWVFGAGFSGAALPLRLLVIGQAGNCFAMVFASILMMGGRERAFAGWNAAMLVVNIALCTALIPSFGASGAAVATASVAVVMLVGQVWLALPLWRGELSVDEGVGQVPVKGKTDVF